MMLRRRISSRPMPELAGGDVEHALAHPRLHRPRAAVRDVRRLVRRGERGREPERGQRGTGPGIIVRIMSGYIAALNGNAGYAPWSIVMCTRSPSSVPSSRSAASTSRVSSRACPAISRCSLRSSIHFTDRPRSTAAASTATSSRVGSDLDAERAADVLGGDARQRHRIPRQEPEHHAGEVHDADRLAQEGLRHRLAR